MHWPIDRSLSAMNIFKSTDEDALIRTLNYGAWFGFLLLAICFVSIAIATMRMADARADGVKRIAARRS